MQMEFPRLPNQELAERWRGEGGESQHCSRGSALPEPRTRTRLLIYNRHYCTKQQQ